ncbi:MAG: 16S rRNA (cytidine(1402)-2'-O)-methyltransferase [Actinobacteria bacterium]|nr:16S rRNA (cytidine(1402)-2'-O)-methyltransferase [Actinomycetota bacterium]
MKSFKNNPGKLYVCATPIGNLEDITIRVIKTLRQVDLIAAEDTRRTVKLLSRYKIKKPIISYYEHNELIREEDLIKKLNDGFTIALVSDAGTPGLADPGYRLIKRCIDEGIEVEVLPGPCAAITALIASGLPTDKFLFYGFLPRKKGQLRKVLISLKDEEKTIIAYESPHRIINLLNELDEIFGERKIVLTRELTKKFEEVLRGTAKEINLKLGKGKPKGEFVLVINGCGKKKKSSILRD